MGEAYGKWPKVNDSIELALEVLSKREAPELRWVPFDKLNEGAQGKDFLF